jgi:hypothetical protein
MNALDPYGRRGRILKACREPQTLSDICRRVAAPGPASRRDASLHRLKTASALRSLKKDGLIARTPWGWAATVAGLDALEAR